MRRMSARVGGGWLSGVMAVPAGRGATPGERIKLARGIVGFKTRIAVGLWQEKNGQKPTCFPDAKLVKSIH